MVTTNELVQFKSGTKAAFDALTTKDPGTIYFITDGTNKTIYKGDEVYTPGTDGIATEEYVTQKISEHASAVDAMVFKGTVATAVELDAKKATAKNGDTYKATAAFTPTDETKKVEIGDMIIARVTDAGFQEWVIVQSNLDGAVTTSGSGLKNNNLVVASGAGTVKGSTVPVVNVVTTTGKNTANAVLLGNGGKTVKASTVTSADLTKAKGVADALDANKDTLAGITKTTAETDQAIADAQDVATLKWEAL